MTAQYEGPCEYACFGNKLQNTYFYFQIIFQKIMHKMEDRFICRNW